jgi:hypothetical protein
MVSAWKQMRAQGLPRGLARQAYGKIGKEFDQRHAEDARTAANLWHRRNEARATARALPAAAKNHIVGEWISHQVAKPEVDELGDRFVAALRKGLSSAKLR